MNKKKVAAMAASLALVAVIGIGATLAYFTDKTDTKTNVVTMGKVDIDLTEESTDEDGKKVGTVTEEGLDFPDIMPGDVLSKIPSVTVDGESQDAYVRVKIGANLGEVLTAAGMNEDMILNWLDIDGSKWVKGAGDYYYYQGITKANDKLTIFTTVTIPNELGNKAANGTFNITIDAEAIQADNVTPEMTNGQITGWPEADIQKLGN